MKTTGICGSRLLPKNLKMKRDFLILLMLTFFLSSCTEEKPADQPAATAPPMEDTIVATPPPPPDTTTMEITDYFQGEIHYKYSYETETKNLGYIISIRPKTGVFKYDLAHYQSNFYGADTMMYYYSAAANRAAHSKNGAFEVHCQDYSQNPDPLVSYKVYETDEKILGQSCKVIEFQSRSSLNKYWVSKEQFLAPATYKDHLAYNWAFYGQQARGGIILKLEHQFQEFTMKGIATKLVPYKNGERAWDISEKAFRLACNLQ